MKRCELKKHPETGKLVQEEWREIEGYDGWYEVSNYGRVRSWKIGGNSNKKSKKPKVLRLNWHGKGYKCIALHHKGERSKHIIHRLVARTFISEPRRNKEVNHKDGNINNNFLHNLEWLTHKENISHAIKNGLHNNRGENHGYSKLKDKEVVMIRELHGEHTHKELAEMFEVSRPTITLILNHKIWTHI